jgi:hypothetical protein
MSFRGHDSGPAPERVDPLARYLALHRQFDLDRGVWGDRVPLRLAAVTMITARGDVPSLVARVRSCDAELAQHFGWLSGVDASVRLVLAAALVRGNETAPAFVAALEHGRTLLRSAKVRRGGVHEVLAMLVLRRVIGGGEIQPAHIERFQAIYAEMKRHHWFLTGSDDFTTCAMLVGRRGTPAEIGEHCEAIYRRLADAPKTRGGDPLQTAANVLGLVDLAPEEAAQRFLDVATALRDAGIKVGKAEYDEVAVLSMIPRAADKVARTVADYLSQIVSEFGWTEKELAISLAANLTFVRLLFDEEGIATLGDAKLLLDMQSIVTARQASGSH